MTAHLPSSLLRTCDVYNSSMSKHHEPLPPELERYLSLCKRTVERMKRDGKWPWRDSPNFDSMVESEDNPDTL